MRNLKAYSAICFSNNTKSRPCEDNRLCILFLSLEYLLFFKMCANVFWSIWSNLQYNANPAIFRFCGRNLCENIFASSQWPIPKPLQQILSQNYSLIPNCVQIIKIYSLLLRMKYHQVIHIKLSMLCLASQVLSKVKEGSWGSFTTQLQIHF